MTSKQEKIKKMLAMQKNFIELDRAQGVSAEQYFTPESGSALDGYRQDYMQTAMEVVDQAHAEKGSHR